MALTSHEYQVITYRTPFPWVIGAGAYHLYVYFTKEESGHEIWDK